MPSPTRPCQYTRPTADLSLQSLHIKSHNSGQPIQDGNRVTEMENDILVVLQFLTWSIPCQPLSQVGPDHQSQQRLPWFSSSEQA